MQKKNWYFLVLFAFWLMSCKPSWAAALDPMGLVEREIRAVTLCSVEGKPKLLTFEVEKYQFSHKNVGLIYYKVQKYDVRSGIDHASLEGTIWQTSVRWYPDEPATMLPPVVGLSVLNSSAYIGIINSLDTIQLFEGDVQYPRLGQLDSINEEGVILSAATDMKTKPIATIPLRLVKTNECAHSFATDLRLMSSSSDNHVIIMVTKDKTGCDVNFTLNQQTNEWNLLQMKEIVPTDSFGIPPKAKFLLPIEEGSSINLGGWASWEISIDVSDDVSVKSVELILDHRTVATQQNISGSRVSFTLTLPKDLSVDSKMYRGLAVEARVTDIGGNSSVVGPIHVNVCCGGGK